MSSSVVNYIRNLLTPISLKERIMAVNNIRQQQAYGLSQPTINVPYAPIVSRRAPTASDKAAIGSTWIDVPNNDSYVLTSIVANSATWINTAGGTGTFNSLVVTTSIIAGTTITAGTGITSTTGNIVATAGAVNAGTTMTAATGITATTGNIVASAGAVNAATSMTATLGNITATAGNFVCSLAGTGVILGGGATVQCGTGDPSATVTATKGSLYLRLDGSSSSTRAYINTDGATAWTNIVTAG